MYIITGDSRWSGGGTLPTQSRYGDRPPLSCGASSPSLPFELSASVLAEAIIRSWDPRTGKAGGDTESTLNGLTRMLPCHYLFASNLRVVHLYPRDAVVVQRPVP